MLACFRTGKKARPKRKKDETEEARKGEAADTEEQGTGPSPHAWPWLHVDYKGNVDLMPSDDASQLIRLGIPERDLRLLIPGQTGTAPVSTFITTRGSAILFAADALRMAITADQVFLVSSPWGIRLEAASPPTTDAAFVRELVAGVRGQGSAQSMREGGSEADRRLPFELRALEAGLGFVVGSLATRVDALERKATPEMDRLAKKVTSEGLLALRQTKGDTRLLAGQATRLSQALRRHSSDQSHMAAMCLTQRARSASSSPSADEAATGRRAGACPPAHLSGLPDLRALLQSYIMQAEAAASRLSTARDVAQDTQQTARLSLKAKHLRIGHH